MLAGWLLAAALVSVRAYQQLPHVLDALSYSFQAGLLSSGRLWLDAPVPIDAFRGPFEVLWQGRLFSQYPPGAPAAYALGRLANLDWLVGPLCGAVLIGATAWTAAVLFDTWTGLVVLWLGALSPFILFQAGSFLSHPVAGALVAGALAVFVAAERSKRVARYSFVGVCLGAAFLVREPASLLFGLPLVARLLKQRQWRGLQSMLLAGVPFLVVYLAYDAVVTGSPFQLPRTLFDPSDHFGFGDGIGFHHRHTLAAGLANTDELLTLLQFDLFGWPPLVGLGLLGLPFLLGRARSWDWVAGGGCLAFVAAYIGYFYHGIALGPRYYYEAVPWLLLLAGRGAGMVCELAGTRLAVMAVLLALSLHTLVFYLPAELERRIDFSGWPDGQRIRLGFVAPSPLGPRLTTVSSPTLVLTNDWWLFNAALSSLNCPRVPDCLVTFALAPTPADAERLQQLYPGRMLLHAVNHGGTVELEP